MGDYKHKHKYKFTGTFNVKAYNELVWKCSICNHSYHMLRWDFWPEPEDKQLNYHVQNYGTVSIEIPTLLSESTFANSINQAIVQTLDLVKPTTQAQRFHPVLGYGGYLG